MALLRLKHYSDNHNLFPKVSAQLFLEASLAESYWMNSLKLPVLVSLQSIFFIKKEVMLNFSDMELEVRNDKKCRISYCLNCMKLDCIVMIQKIIHMNADDERRTKDKFSLASWPYGKNAHLFVLLLSSFSLFV